MFIPVLRKSLITTRSVLAVCSTDGVTLISKDEVEGSAVSRAEANQVPSWKHPYLHQRELFRQRDSQLETHTDRNLFCPQFLVAEEKKEEVSAPPAEDTGDVDDLVCVIFMFCEVSSIHLMRHVKVISCPFARRACLMMCEACWDLSYKLSCLAFFLLPLQLDMM